MITYKLDRVKGELKGINSEFDGGWYQNIVSSKYGGELNGIPPETDGGPNRAEYAQNICRMLLQTSTAKK